MENHFIESEEATFFQLLVFFSLFYKITPPNQQRTITTGLCLFAVCQGHTAKAALHSAKCLPSVTHGKQLTANNGRHFSLTNFLAKLISDSADNHIESSAKSTLGRGSGNCWNVGSWNEQSHQTVENKDTEVRRIPRGSEKNKQVKCIYYWIGWAPRSKKETGSELFKLAFNTQYLLQ